MEQREKEKKEQQAARQRILAQIEQDKADRAARFQTNQNPSTSKQPSPQPARKPAPNSNIARLQFRLPDGNSCTQDFQSTNTLQDVRDYVKSNLNLTFSNFTLSTTFPRREFMNNDLDKTMLELELIPNAVILVLPLSHGAVSTNPGNFISLLLWSFVTPFLNLFGYLKTLIYGTPPPDTSSTTQNQNNKRPSDNKSDTPRYGCII